MSDTQSADLEKACPHAVRHLKLQMVEDDTDLTETTAMDIADFLELTVAKRAVSIQVSGWFHKGLNSKLASILRRSGIIRLLNYKSSGPLNLSTTIAPDQHLEVIGAPAMEEIVIGSNITKISATACPKLMEVTCAHAPCTILEMSFTGCESLHLSNSHDFTLLTDLLISHSALHEDILASPALRRSLVNLTVVDCTGPSRLEIVNFLALKKMIMSDSHVWTELFVSDSTAITSLDFKRCTVFTGVLPHIRDLPQLISAIYEDCPAVKSLIVNECTVLESLKIMRTGINMLSIIAQSCPKLQFIKLSDNPGFWAGSLKLQGSFPNLGCLQARGNFLAGLPNGLGAPPVLRTLDLGGNRLEYPLDLSRFTALERLDIKSNTTHMYDRGGLPFQLRVFVSKGSRVKMHDPMVVLLKPGQLIDADRLPPVPEGFVVVPATASDVMQV